MIWIIIILVYIVSVIIHMDLIYHANDWRIFTLGDLVDCSEGWMYIPIINTIGLLALLLTVILIGNYIGVYTTTD